MSFAREGGQRSSKRDAIAISHGAVGSEHQRRRAALLLEVGEHAQPLRAHLRLLGGRAVHGALLLRLGVQSALVLFAPRVLVGALPMEEPCAHVVHVELDGLAQRLEARLSVLGRRPAVCGRQGLEHPHGGGEVVDRDAAAAGGGYAGGECVGVVVVVVVGVGDSVHRRDEQCHDDTPTPV